MGGAFFSVIEYMVSLRCKLMVKEELEKLGLHYVELDLGMVETQEDATPEQLLQKRLLFPNQNFFIYLVYQDRFLIQ